MSLRGSIICITLSAVLAAPGISQAGGKLKPYVLAWQGQGDLKEKTSWVKTTLKENGFQVVGQYAPYKTARIIAFTNSTIKGVAAKSRKGGFGLVGRATVTKVGKSLQVAYTNPIYWSHAFRMKGSLAAVATALEKALGKVKEFGAEGLTKGKLRDYHYKVLMPYFTDLDKLASYGSYKEALAAVNKGLSKRQGGAKRVYRVNVPGKQETVYGIQLAKDCASEKHYMKKIDYAKIRSTPFLPYQLLVSGKTVYALRGRFRIAVGFPDLTMGTFMKISCAPGDIQDALELVANPDKD